MRYAKTDGGKDYYKITEKNGTGVSLIKEHSLSDYYNVYLFDKYEGGEE